MLLGAIANQGVSLDTLDAGVTAEIARLVANGVTDAELTKAKNGYRADVINGRQSVASVAEALQTANQFLGNPNAVNGLLDRYMKVTTADIKRVASTYLRPDNSLTLLVSKDGK
jgi:predicted Zn-dependent peptidase